MNAPSTARETLSDGRTARRERNRELVLDAVLELFAEDSLAPGAAEVAERSGVSLRSVYRYFDDVDGLARAAIARHYERMQPLFVLEAVGEGPLADRIERIVASRFRLYGQLAPMMRAANARASSNELIRQTLQVRLADLSDQVEAMFAPELAVLPDTQRREVVAGLDVLLGFPTIEHLYRSRGFGEAEAHQIVTRAVTALVVAG